MSKDNSPYLETGNGPRHSSPLSSSLTLKNPDYYTPLLESPSDSPLEIKVNLNDETNSYYPKFLILIGIFYLLPSLQFVFFSVKRYYHILLLQF